jgi:hypothetical protein
VPEKIKTRQHTGDKDSNENDKFNMIALNDKYTDSNKNRRCITSVIKHWVLSGYESVLWVYKINNLPQKIY